MVGGFVFDWLNGFDKNDVKVLSSGLKNWLIII